MNTKEYKFIHSLATLIVGDCPTNDYSIAPPTMWIGCGCVGEFPLYSGVAYLIASDAAEF